jgi:hypothetical protein
VSFRIAPALAALGALLKKPFQRKAKKGAAKTYEVPLAEEARDARGPSLRGTGKASRALRRRRRWVIAHSFTRLLAAKPIGAASVGPLGARWRRAVASFGKRWDAQGRKPLRLGRRAQKRAARFRYALKVRAWKAVRQ